MTQAVLRGRLAAATAFALALGGAFASGCGNNDPAAPPMATPTVTLSADRVPLGNPIEMTYRFVVAADAKFTHDYRVMVHFVDQDQGLMYADDHDPPVPTSAWKPGQTIEYKRKWFAPIYPYVGAATIELGLFCKGCELRAPLTGDDVGHRAYTVARLQLLPQNEGTKVIYKDGWHESEGAEGSGEGSWHWTKKNATLAIKNPRKDSTLYLKIGNPGGPFKEPQHVAISIESGAPVDELTVTPNQNVTLRTIPVSAAAWGTNDMSEVHISVDKVFVPNEISRTFNDSRQLGVRLFRAVVVPSGS
jgi:hypothetical protein